MEPETSSFQDSTVGSPVDAAEVAPAPPPPVEPGIAIGRYTVRAYLGSGGMGDVFAAHDPKLDRLVAVKVMRGGHDRSPEARARFQREAQAMARLNHPNVVSVFDAGRFGESVYVAMELVEGPSMRVWLGERPRAWREVVAVFLQAGKGLAAAHAAGIVHRDFKPGNVILGDRVRVVDFGLARSIAGDPATAGDKAAGAERPLDATVTLTGHGPGTPTYMAPEQRDGAPASLRSDQYAFAVTLHEALYGARPGQPLPPGRAPVPRSLRKLLDRALAARPEDRYASMDLLLTDLARDPARTRRRLLAAAAIVAATCGAVYAARRGAAAPACLDAAPLIAPVWDDAARARVEPAFRASGRSYGADTFQRVDATLRAFQGRWARAHREACEATHVRHEQSPALLDARMRCLTRVKAEMAELVTLFGRADAATVDRAAQAATRTGELDACVDPAVAADAPPPEPERRAQADGIRQDLARLAALRALAQRGAITLARDLVARARRLGHPPLLADVLAVAGKTELLASGDFDAGLALLYEAVQVGSAAGDDAAVAGAAIDVVHALNIKERLDAADVAYHGALAAVARVGNPLRLLTRLYMYRANTLGARGDRAGELPLRLLILALEERVSGPDSMGVASALGSVAGVMTTLGQARRSLPMHDRAVAIAEGALGPRHRVLGMVLINAGTTRFYTGDADGGAPQLERGLAIAEEIGDEIYTAWALEMLALVRVEQRRLAEGRELAERAIAIRVAKYGADSPEVVEARMPLGEVLQLTGKSEEAHRMYREGLVLEQKVYGAAHTRVGTLYKADAGALLDLGRVAEARAAIEQAMAIDAKTVAADHPNHGWTLFLQGEVTCDEGRCAEALPGFRQAVTLLEGNTGDDSPLLVGPLAGVSAAALAAGDLPGARAAAERAVSLAGHAPPDRRARAQVQLARVEWETPAERPAALARARAARADLAARSYAPYELARIDAWLAARR